MTRRDLDDPLRGKAPRTIRWRFNIAPAVISAAVLVALVAATWIAVIDDPQGGMPVATAAIEDAPAVTGSLGAAAAGPRAAAMPTIASLSPGIPPADTASAGLLELSEFGPLPRIAPDGRRPREAYAKRAAKLAPGAPKVALIVGGLGISQTGTQRAIESLPDPVTLAFAPLGSSLQRWVDRARADGHEIVMQIPLEPEGYPQANPGEHTLLVSAERQANERELRWNLGRMTSYAGVMNYMGARFTSDEQALALLLGEIGQRGLFYLDDASSRASRADAVGAALDVPVLTADLIVDRNRSPAGIGEELSALEAMARDKGFAIGVATAFPATVDILSDWVREASRRGIAIVPASALIPATETAVR